MLYFQMMRILKYGSSSRQTLVLWSSMSRLNLEHEHLQNNLVPIVKPFIHIISLLIRSFRLKRQYNGFNKSLKQTDTGLTYDELQKNPQTKTLISESFSCISVNCTFIYLFLADLQLSKFPWWPDLYGWWRTNPAYNTIFSTADPGQNYESTASGKLVLAFFGSEWL